MSFWDKLLTALQYEITRPASYGAFHFFWIALTLILLIVLIKAPCGDRDRRLKALLLVYGISALFLELGKQIIWSYSFDAEAGRAVWDYQWYAAPFQLCTTPIFASLIAAFLRPGRGKGSLLSYMAFFTILGSLATAIYPESCFVRTLWVDIHTMVLHFGSLLVSLYLLMTGEVNLTRQSLLRGCGVFLLFAALAEALNLGVYHSGILNGETFNMFYISPYFISSLPVFDSLQQSLPFPVFLLIYLAAIFAGGTVIFLLARLIRRLRAGKAAAAA